MSQTINPALSRGALGFTGILSILQGLLIFVPTFVLGAAINWPDSLDYPASQLLPELIEQEGAVRFGYIAYLIYSILFVVSMFMLTKLSSGKAMASMFGIILAFAVASTTARSIGIVRWLVPMPQLAESWNSAATDQERYAISVTYDSLNLFGGTVGEVLGVSIFAALSLLAISIAFLRDGLPKWIGIFGLVSVAALLATTTELMGFEPDTFVLVFGTTAIQLWFLAVGLWLLVKAASSKNR
uniref:DUF4386 family protein n=1 Tax=uncultured Micrococcales bacterium TaxID=1920814 RepID=A0A871YEE7_9MICO|nr:hypothetical protein HULAa2F4_00001 [uncultured Micrococcales bacterium]QOV09046.1 hypothetical protein HULAa3G5_00032 [uncultured Micrococcales bacterium]